MTLVKLVVIGAAFAVMTSSARSQAAAPSVELAKKCRQLTVKAHPPALPGTKRGSAQAERDYFAECIRKRGEMDQESPQKKDSPG